MIEKDDLLKEEVIVEEVIHDEDSDSYVYVEEKEKPHKEMP
jgi:hypothetical protein